MEEEVGAYGHDETVIIAEEKDSKQAKATSAVQAPHKDSTTADHQEVNVKEHWSDSDIKVLEGMSQASQNVTTNANAEGEGDQDQSQYFTEANPEEEPAEALTEEELEQQRIEEENRKIEENFDAYSEMNVEEETKKLQEKELAKNKKKAVSVAQHMYLKLVY